MPTRSASASLSREKLICCWAAGPWPIIVPLDRLPAAAPAESSEDDGSEHRGRGGDGLLSLGVHLLEDMVLGDVRDFVRHDPGQLRFTAGGQDQSVVDED